MIRILGKVAAIAACVLVIILAQGSRQGPEFNYLPPDQVVYWQPPEGFDRSAGVWSPPPEYQWTTQAWAPPEGWERPSAPWAPPEGWGEPKEWAPPSEFI
jgi:hypothetical protein